MSIDSAAASSSEPLMDRSVWGMVRAAWAMTWASWASVLALPGVRSAMRLMDRPGRHPTSMPMSWATATASAPMAAHLVHDHQQPAVLSQTVVEVA